MNAIKSVASQKTLNIVFIVALLVVIGYVFFLKPSKIVYVDSSKILAEYKGAMEAKQKYTAKTSVWQANIDSLTSEIQSAIKKYERDLAVMSKKEQELSKQLLDSKQRQLADYQRAIQENARQEDMKISQAVVSEINAFITDYGKKNRYQLILIANQSGTIAYAEEGLDVTHKVLEEMNKNYKSK